MSNTAASIHGRLLHLARQRGEDLQYVLFRFANERLLYRLSASDHADAFVLKGASLFLLNAFLADRAGSSARARRSQRTPPLPR